MIAQTFVIEVHTESDMVMTVSQVADVLTGFGWDGWTGEEGERPTPTGWIREAVPGPGGHSLGGVIECEGCSKQTTDPDLWDPEADTGRIFCDACWPKRDS